MDMSRGYWVMSLLALGLVQGCAVGTPNAANICTDAAQHLEDCGVVSVSLAEACEGEHSSGARVLLEMSCDELALVTAEPGKSDFWSSGNPLCGFLVGASGLSADALWCFDRNCAGDNVCNGYRCSPRASFGDACDRDSHCDGDWVCGADDTCVDPLAAGQACARDSSCDGDLRCITGECAARSGAGEVCDDGDDADCDSGLGCWEGVCRARASNGGACADSFDCEFGLGCVSGYCGDEPGLGEACDVGDIGDCPLDLACIGGTCQPEPGLGDTCEREPRGMCGSGNTCWNGVCERRHGLSAPCEDLFDCGGDLFCIEGRCMP